uniref:Secreted protein n=1 Tax=Anopheles darlingi TaxID=43151 RepID=A0A2M4DHY4_ANODA
MRCVLLWSLCMFHYASSLSLSSRSAAHPRAMLCAVVKVFPGNSGISVWSRGNFLSISAQFSIIFKIIATGAVPSVLVQLAPQVLIYVLIVLVSVLRFLCSLFLCSSLFVRRLP